MNPFTAANNGVTYWRQSAVKHKEIEHPSTVVVCENKHEQSYVLSWCESNKMIIQDYMKSNDKFPYCLSVYGDVVGHLREMDRALYYMSFTEFMGKIKNENNRND